MHWHREKSGQFWVRTYDSVGPENSPILKGMSGVLDSPIDPFSGKAYRYRRKDSSYRLYSVSTNGTDDGGVLAPANDKGFADLYAGDLVWKVTKPSAPS